MNDIMPIGKSTKCLVYVSVPGTFSNIHENGLITELINNLKSVGVSSTIVDSATGWGCPNQDWLEFECDLLLSFAWPDIVPFVGFHSSRFEACEAVDLNSYYKTLFHHGHLLMMVHYRLEDGTLQPHS
jgi:hypothetical protein